jgi:sugar phosphate isomerase/epimerase
MQVQQPVAMEHFKGRYPKMERKMKAGITMFQKIGSDPWDRLETLAKIGYRTSQDAVMTVQRTPGDLDENIARYKAMGMAFYSAMVAPGKTPVQFNYSAKPTIVEGYHDLGFAHRVDDEQIAKTVATCEKFAINLVTQYSSPILNPRFGLKPCERDIFYEAIEKMETTAERFKATGIRYCYHNHDLEFLTAYDGKTAFEQLLSRTSSLAIELDVGWVLAGCEDPERILKRCAARVASLHMKDLVPGTWVRQQSNEVRPTFTALGTGMLKLESILQAAFEQGLTWAIVEQDDMRNLSELETATVSYLNMKETGFVA